MQNVIYAATSFGYCVQVIKNGEVIYEYTAGNHRCESQTIVDPKSPQAVKLPQIKRWAKQTAREIANERGIAPGRIEYDPDLETTIREIT